jgi:hypothetical protein
MSRILWMIVSIGGLSACVTANDQPRGPSPIQVRRDDWIICVTRSYITQSKLTPDKSLAVEQAFLACRTEEAAIPGSLAGDPGFQVRLGPVITALKAKLKSDLIASGP